MRRTLLLVTCLLPAWAAAAAPRPEDAPLRGCPTPVAATLPPLPPPTPRGEIEFQAPRVEADLNGETVLPEGVEIHFGSRLLSAPFARYDQDTGNIQVTGDVVYRDPALWVHGSEADFVAAQDRIDVQSGDFELPGVPARGSAGRITLESGNQLSMQDVRYTTCAAGHEDWLLKASSLSVDGDTGTGTARNARLEFMGVPIFYTPWISYPVTNQRKTGFLLPVISSSNRRGFELGLPYYVNLAPNYDATLTPRIMTKRGFELDSDVRYLLPDHDGEFRAELLPHDDVTGDTRYLFGWTHQSLPADNWRLSVDARTVSDKQYFEDLYGSLSATSQTFLERRVDLQYLDDFWSLLMRVQDYQTLDDTIAPPDKPYVRLPELAARGQYVEGPLGVAAAVDSEFTWFERSTGVTGARLHVAPELSWPLRYRGVSLEPAVVLDYTHYGLRDTAPGAPANPTRTLPIYSADLSTVFERLIDGSVPWLQTIEPRVEYVRIPYRQQDDLPVFDTTEPDFNLVQLFRKNRFVGLDRIGDTNQLSVGLTTRLLDAGSGAQILSATLGQARYFTPTSVTLPGGSPSSDAASNYVAELGMRLQPRWNLDLGYQWNTDTSRTELAEARVQYRPDRARVLSLGYRYRADTLDEIEVAGAWPITDRWNVVSRYDYSIFDHQTLEALVGLEYQNCCWGVRLTARRHLASRDGSSDTSVALQLVLKGLGNPTEPADRILENGILGYERD